MNKRIKTTGNREMLINQDLVRLGKKLIKRECECDIVSKDLAAIFAIVASIRYTTRDDFNFSLGYQWFTYDGARRSDKAIAIDLGREVTPMHDEVHSTLYFIYGDHGKLLGIGINKDNDPYINQDLYVEFENLNNEISTTLYGMVEDMYMDARRAIFDAPLKYIKTCGCDCEDDECIDDDFVCSLEDVSDEAPNGFEYLDTNVSEMVKAYNTVDKVLDTLKIGKGIRYVGNDYENDWSVRSYHYCSRPELMGLGLSALLIPNDGDCSRANLLKNMKYTFTRYATAITANDSDTYEYRRSYYLAALRYLFVCIVQGHIDLTSDMVTEFNRIRNAAEMNTDILK